MTRRRRQGRGGRTAAAWWMAIFGGLLLGGGAARAEALLRMHGAQVRLEGERLVVAVRASGTLRPVRHRLQGDELRVWFASAGEGRADVAGDRRAIRSVRLRPGYGTTGLVRIRLRPGHRLRAADVQVAPTERGAHIELPAAAFPALAREVARRDDEAPGEAATPPGETARSAAKAPAGEPHEAGAGSAEASAGRGDASAKPSEASSEPAALGIRQEAGLGSLALMFLLVSVLGAAYGAVRWVSRRRAGGLRAPIEVVAAQRLGPRHQLVLVRALGEEHLLSIQGTQTTCIASAPIVEDEEGAEADPEPEQLRSGIRRRLGTEEVGAGGARSLFDRLSERPPASAAGQRAARSFGAALMEQAARRQRAGTPPRAAGSEAIAGLLSLRRRAAGGR